MDRSPALLGIYLNDHLGGSTAGAELSRRIAREHRGAAHGSELRRIADEIAEDRRALLDIMDRLGFPARRYKIYGGWAAEKAGRIKPNGRVRRRSGLSTVIELESLRLGVEGKAALWRALLGLSPRHPGLDTDRIERLLHRAEDQSETLESLRLAATSRVFDPTHAPERTG
ncbi:hypothetical protein [Streptomyces sp. bgisy100]|uniref:hypothetical protein n=1 Tax=Streptomyces sp. bgisy100 TaxID=3413783 RepID=UPI003D750045